MPLFYYHLIAIPLYSFLYLRYKNGNEKAKSLLLYALCALCVIFYFINNHYFFLRGSHILTMLPLQLCNIGVFLIPITIIWKRPYLLDFVFYVSALGALAALLTPNSDYSDIPYSLMTLSFYISHSILAVVPLMLAGWGFYKPQPSIKKALRLSATVLILAGGLHLLNLILGKVFAVEANYFFTVIQYSAPINPVFELFSKLIPYDFFFLIPALPILYLYMALVAVLSRTRPSVELKG